MVRATKGPAVASGQNSPVSEPSKSGQRKVAIAVGTDQLPPVKTESARLPPLETAAESQESRATSLAPDETSSAASITALTLLRRGGTIAIGQKLSHAGIALSFGALGEASGQILGSFIHLGANGLGHACGVLFASSCSILLFFAKPVTLRGKLIYYARLHKRRLLTKQEYQELRRRCLSAHRH